MTRIEVASEGSKAVYQIGVITGGRLYPLSIAKSISPDIYGDLAF
jgi:hypothetical protein